MMLESRAYPQEVKTFNFAFGIATRTSLRGKNLIPRQQRDKRPIMFTRACSVRRDKKGDDVDRHSAAELRYFWKSKRLEIASSPQLCSRTRDLTLQSLVRGQFYVEKLWLNQRLFIHSCASREDIVLSLFRIARNLFCIREIEFTFRA